VFDVRVRRVRPHRDDKILTDWNGLFIAGLAKASRTLGNNEYLNAAEQAMGFLLTKMMSADGRLFHRFRDGEVLVPGFLDDYAFLVWGLIELYETTFDIDHLKVALTLNGILDRDFWDTERGGYFFSPRDGEAMITRVKEVYDGAVPSGNSVAMLNLVRLGRMTATPELEDQAEKIGRVFYDDVTRSPSTFTLLMTAFDFGAGPSRELIIVGDPGSADTGAMLRAVHTTYSPTVVLLFKPSDEKDPEISRIAEFTSSHETPDGKATAYVCSNYACKLPTTDIDAMLGLLNESPE
ncbi:MAG: thioredoxin domain-containing protein, partial [Candidatus Latescibacterota bacterium]